MENTEIATTAWAAVYVTADAITDPHIDELKKTLIVRIFFREDEGIGRGELACDKCNIRYYWVCRKNSERTDIRISASVEDIDKVWNELRFACLN